MKSFLLIFFSLLFTNAAYAQVDMADVMRSNGKIYVVVAVALLVMLGLLGYMFTLDRKISALEKKIRNKSSQ